MAAGGSEARGGGDEVARGGSAGGSRAAGVSWGEGRGEAVAARAAQASRECA